jgi:general secretion pathway protein G
MLNGFFKQRQGFTLIEIVAVLAILGMMAIMLMPSIDIASNRAKDTKMVSDLVTLDSAVKLYRLENEKYPESLADLQNGYVANKVYKDAAGEKIVYDHDGASYTLTGTKTNGDVIMADGSKVEKQQTDAGNTDVKVNG